jgi:hypothetical protein
METGFDPRSAEKHWLIFRDGPIGAFLTQWLSKRLEDVRTSLETTSDHPGKLQGQALEIRSLQSLLARGEVHDPVEQVKQFLAKR